MAGCGLKSLFFGSARNRKSIGSLIGRSEAAVRTKAREMGISLILRGDFHQSAKYPQSDIELTRQLHQRWRVQENRQKIWNAAATVNNDVYFDRRVLRENPGIQDYGPVGQVVISSTVMEFRKHNRVVDAVLLACPGISGEPCMFDEDEVIWQYSVDKEGVPGSVAGGKQ